MSFASTNSLDPNMTNVGKSYAQTQNQTGGRTDGSGQFSAGGKPDGTGRLSAPLADTVIPIAPTDPTAAAPSPLTIPAATLDPPPPSQGQFPPVQQQPFGPPGGQRRKQTIQLCCCESQQATISMGCLDTVIAFIHVLLFLTIAPPQYSSPHLLYSILGFSSSLLFVILGVILILAGINRSKILCGIFLVGNTVLFIASMVVYFVLFYDFRVSSLSIPFLLSAVLLYKIYESVCIIFFCLEKPPPAVQPGVMYGGMHGGGAVVPVVYSPAGLHYPNGYGYGSPYGNYYGNPGYGFSTPRFNY